MAAKRKKGSYRGIRVRVSIQVRKTYTGKLYGKQDDLCIALQLALVGAQKFYQEPKYASFRTDDWADTRGFRRV